MLLASFNGGPTDTVVIVAVVAAAVAGFFVGAVLGQRGVATGFRVLVGLAAGAVVCGAVLFLGNRPGTEAGFFLAFGLVILTPLAGMIAGLTSAVAGRLTWRGR